MSENPIGENLAISKKVVSLIPLVKIQKPLRTKEIEFSPTQFSPTRNRVISPTKKPKLKLVSPSKKGLPGRPRNPDLPPSPGKYFYWGKARNGLKLERRRPEYEYIGFIMPNEWEHLRGTYDEDYALRVIIAAIRVKRSRSAESRRTGARTA